MTDQEQPPPPPGAGPPPPGWPPPGGASEYAGRPGGPEAAGWAAPAYGVPLGRPLHKPGTVPLRPLTLTDIFDGSFTTIRRNPKATIGVAALVTLGFMLLPAVVTVVLGLTGQVPGFDRAAGGSSPFENAALTVANLIAGLFGFLASIVVTGLIVPVVTRATIGEKLTAGAAWQQAKGRLVRLLLLALLEGLVAVVVLGVPITLAVLFGYAVGRDSGGGLALAILLGILIVIAALCAMLAIHIKWFQLAAAVVVVEKRGVFAALGRSGRLVKGQFWRILGIYLLTVLATTILNQIVGVPFAIVGAGLAVGFPGAAGTVGLLLASNVASIVSGAIVGPFTGAVAVLQYLDQRFRKEGFDIELINHVQSRRAALMPVPLEPFLPDPGTAHDLLRAELYKREYQPSLLERVQQWFQDLLDKVQGGPGGLGGLGGLVVLLLTLLLLAVAVVVLSRLRRTTGGERVAEPVFGEVRRTAAEHRRLAQAAYDGGAWDEAVVEGMRALAARLVERQLVDDVPAATAHEVTTQAAPRFPAHADRLGAASRVFDETRYGDRRATRDHATAMLELDRTVAAASPVPSSGGSRGPVAAVPR